jgi:L-aspartate oxidase
MTLVDVLVIGSGIAGLNTVIKLNKNLKVALVTKTNLGDGASWMAQGGIAAVSKDHDEDSLNSHIKDTIKVGGELCKEKVVSYCVKKGPKAINELINFGVKFNLREKKKNIFDLTKEGGHSHRRIYHSGDITGEAIIGGLLNKVKERKNLKIFEDCVSIDLIAKRKKVIGAYILDCKKQKIHTFKAKTVVLATGGAGKVYLYTSNPDTATGDGIAMAYRAGANISNMEFFQFHPTCLYHPRAKNFLISEALRGEGAKLKLKDGKEFMAKYHKDKELAPRDIVARAIDKELKKSGENSVFLDIRHKGKAFIKKRFPNIYRKCKSFGIDITSEMIPVVPAAHYLCGGIKVNLKGKTNIKNLYACGEVSFTGFHGANRLASNSLLEAFVFSNTVSQDINENISKIKDFKDPKPWKDSWVKTPEENILIHHNWDELRRTMWNKVGIVRSVTRLKSALKRISVIQEETKDFYWKHYITKDLIELRNLITVSNIIIKSALKRKESRGLHYLKDFPKKNSKFLKDTNIKKK